MFSNGGYDCRDAFQADLELGEDVQAGVNTITNLQSLCDIRCSSRANALLTFKSAFTAVVTALEYLLEEDGNGKTRCYLLSVKHVDFNITLVTIEQNGLPLIIFLQSKQCNLCQRGNHYYLPAAAREGRPRSVECILALTVL